MTAQVLALHPTSRVGRSAGHGHVWPRPDGFRVNCGGPELCELCARDAELVARQTPPASVEPRTQEDSPEAQAAALPRRSPVPTLLLAATLSALTCWATLAAQGHLAAWCLEGSARLPPLAAGGALVGLLVLEQVTWALLRWTLSEAWRCR